MQIRIVRLDFGKKKLASILHGACWHIGNPAAHDECRRKFLSRAAKRPWTMHGDAIEGITPSDRRFEAETHGQTLLQQIKYTGKELRHKGANKSCIGMTEGNHEAAPSRIIGTVASSICDAGDIPYLSDCAFLQILAPKGSCVMFVAHGSGSCSPSAGTADSIRTNQRNILRRKLRGFIADVKVVAHYHKGIIAPAICHPEPAIELRLGKIAETYPVTIPEWVAACPSMFKTYQEGESSNYASRSLFRPSDIGWLDTVFDEEARVCCMRQYKSDGTIKRVQEPELLT